MLVVIVSIMLLVSGIIGCIVDHYLFISEQSFSFWLIKVSLNAVGILALMISMILILSVRLNADVDYQNTLAEKQMLEYRINKQDDIVGNELLYSQIVAFNNDLRSTKKWANNIWTNWFYNQDIANKIDYIVVE